MIFDEIMRRVSRDDNGCWNFAGAHLASGYGSVRYAGRGQVVHRVVYERLEGPIPPAAQLDHLCRNRGCCNPDHLEPVTQKVNLLRGASPPAFNARKTHCPNGHEYDIHTPRGRECRTCKKARRRKHYLASRTEGG